MAKNKAPHTAVLEDEVASFFEGLALKCFVDATLGGGGHAERMLRDHPTLSRLIGIDRDPVALDIARRRLLPYEERVILKRAVFSEIPDICRKLKCATLDGALFDLGVSSMQLDVGERGFSFLKDGPLDMRMDQDAVLTAAKIVNEWSEDRLGEIIRDYGEEPYWRSAARAIVKARQKAPIVSTRALVQVLDGSVLKVKQRHFATLVFQALRIAVNDELGVVQRTLPAVLEMLRPGGRMAVITFHSLEDRIVKECFKMYGRGNKRQKIYADYRVLTKKPLVATDAEMKKNPRSRSAKLRVIEKLQESLNE